MFTRKRKSSIRLIQRVYLPRITGLAFAAVCVATFLLANEASAWKWGLLILWGIMWPHIAHQKSMRSQNPLKSEVQNLALDAFMIGFWVPVMSFSFIPSIAIMGMHLLSIISVLGLGKASIGLLLELFGVLVGTLIVGFHVDLHADMYLIYASVPMLLVYPLFVGNNAYMLSLKLSAKQSVLRKLSRTDGLTGLNNRMYWEEQIDWAFKLNKRQKLIASIVFIDADHFKRINDSYGHIAGDEVLRNIAKLLMECARETDICGRYGGEEFCILMPDTDKEEAKILSERLRIKVDSALLHDELKIKGSISLGVAEISHTMENYRDWLAVADQALYQAKRQGRNRTVIAQPDTPSH